MRKDFKFDILGLGINNSGYAGGFTPVVVRLINGVMSELQDQSDQRIRVLHLFSGSSEIGDVRVDLECRQATNREDVLSFIRYNKSLWDLVILDPPYGIEPRNKLDEYKKTSSLAADVLLRRELVEYFRTYVKDILWLDTCAPLPEHFYRVQMWTLLPGGYRPVRVLSWIRNERRFYR